MASPQKLILVTGGAGFVGSHLCERLSADGHRVISLDDYSVGSKDNHVAGVEYREGHTKDIATLVPETPDLIYHLGEYSRVHQSLVEPDKVFKSNTEGTIAVLEFWREKKCKLIYAASSTKSEISKPATGGEGRDLAPYTFTKAMNVDLIGNYGRWYVLPYAIVYFYNVYGPRERTWGNMGTVIATFLENVRLGKPHLVNAPGTQTRSFTHVLDTVDGIVRAGEAGEGDGYAISADDVHSILEVAQMCGGDIEMQTQTATSRSSGKDDTSKIEALGWTQRHYLKEYIANAKQS
ncbi:MAG: NAD-dependent epimerase/dehydratase family protein [Candidatus Pacebacteria bacterium]|nr:NAD-dependent epimerase/dehydratase family protein [Candidatus Paceibacterota bacterium]MBP9840737.1 NAD-dependent epimerase/dehydratase family protein [Candidatus Paceibacterota bacterium]